MSEIVVRPKIDTCLETAQFYGDLFGVSALLKLNTKQIWKAHKSGKYWVIKGKGDFQMRVTESAMNKLFEMI